jgi:hypothetical protein
VNKKTTQIICTNYKNGKCHDFRLFKESKIVVHPEIAIGVDTVIKGYKKYMLEPGSPRREAKNILYLKRIRKRTQTCLGKGSLLKM